jgi:hypothetical protein
MVQLEDQDETREVVETLRQMHQLWLAQTFEGWRLRVLGVFSELRLELS